MTGYVVNDDIFMMIAIDCAPIFVPSDIKISLIYLCSLTYCFIIFDTGFSRWRCLKGGRSPTVKHLHREADI